MAASENHETPDVMSRLFTLRNGTFIFLTFCIGITLVSVGITETLARVLGPIQDKMGPVGQIFESVNAAFSGLGFIALVVTFRVQYGEFRLQRQELKNQHAAMIESQGHLGRSALCDIRARHVELIKMSMDDPDLAEVWPTFQVGASTKLVKQYSYANLIIQHQRLGLEVGLATEAEMRDTFHYLFTSPIIRAYWEARMVAREVALETNTSERAFDNLIDQAYVESVLLESPLPSSGGSAQIIDLDAHGPTDSASDAA